MNKYLSASWNSVVSLDLENSWAARSLQDALRQARYDARFQQKQMQEKEEKLLKLYENQQQRAFERVGRGSAGSNGSLTTTITTGKVRQMFDERRQKAGIDRSYPLEPLKNSRLSNGTNRTTSLDRKNSNNIPAKSTVKTTVHKSTSLIRNGNQLVNKREVSQRVWNNNGDEERYQESRYMDDEADNFMKQRDIVALMNDHNLSDNLEDEEMPRIGFEDYDDSIFNGKLANVGGKLPSQNEPIKKPTTKVISNGVTKSTKPIKKESTPNLKNTVIKNLKTATTTPSTNSISPSRSPSKMSSKATHQAGDRVPSSNRPSSRPGTRPPNVPVQRDDYSACRYCQRRFLSDRLATHEDICSRTSKKKRKTYDATKHRLAGTELEPYGRKTGKQGKTGAQIESTKNTKPTSKAKASISKSNWRQKHEEFISTIRAAKLAQAHIAKGGNIRDLPPPPPSSNPDYVQCPHCGRRFNESAAQRHIPKCATYEFNKPKASTGGASKPPPPGPKKSFR